MDRRRNSILSERRSGVGGRGEDRGGRASVNRTAAPRAFVPLRSTCEEQTSLNKVTSKVAILDPILAVQYRLSLRHRRHRHVISFLSLLLDLSGRDMKGRTMGSRSFVDSARFQQRCRRRRRLFRLGTAVVVVVLNGRNKTPFRISGPPLLTLLRSACGRWTPAANVQLRVGVFRPQITSISIASSTLPLAVR